MPKKNIFWIDLLSGGGTPEVPSVFAERFSVQMLSNTESLDRLVHEEQALACVFEFDYPDRRELDKFARFKDTHASIPVILVTVQHSEALAKWAFRTGALDFLVHPLVDSEVDHCVKRLMKIEAAREQAGRRVAIKHAKPIVPMSIPGAPKSKQERLAPAINFVQHNYSQRISSDMMARMCDMSASHFSREFRSIYGLTFQEFLLRFRVNQACQHFDGRPVNISEVAYSVGFADPSYFTRIFKRYVGVAPSDYIAANDDDSRIGVKQPASVRDDSSTSQVVKSLANSFNS